MFPLSRGADVVVGSVSWVVRGHSFIAALPPVEECPSCHDTFAASTRSSFITIDYKQSGATGTPLGVSFAWLDASLQREFVAAFDKLDSPGLVAFSPRKKAYATFGASPGRP